MSKGGRNGDGFGRVWWGVVATEFEDARNAQGRGSPFQQQIPTIATAEQLAASITFLLSDDGVNINGAVLPSDGGWSVQ